MSNTGYFKGFTTIKTFHFQAATDKKRAFASIRLFTNPKEGSKEKPINVSFLANGPMAESLNKAFKENKYPSQMLVKYSLGSYEKDGKTIETKNIVEYDILKEKEV